MTTILWTDLNGASVVSLQNGQTLGKIRGAFMDPETNRLLGFLVGFSQLLAPVDIEKWAPQIVLVSGPEVLISPLDLRRLKDYGLARCLLNGKKVLNRQGHYFGRLHNFVIEINSQQILKFFSSRRFLIWRGVERIFAAQDVFEVTKKALILKADPEEYQKFKERILQEIIEGKRKLIVNA